MTRLADALSLHLLRDVSGVDIPAYQILMDPRSRRTEARPIKACASFFTEPGALGRAILFDLGCKI